MPDKSAPFPPPALAQRLGYAGLLPFVALASAAWLAPVAMQALAVQALVAYGATIASFLGAIHWGLAMRPGARTPALSFGWGVVPSLLAWVALLVNPGTGLLLLTALLGVCFAVDAKVYPPCGLRAWLPMRFALTLFAGLSCLAAALALQRA